MGKLQIVSPVPSDIDVAHSVEPVPITEIAERLGLSTADIDLHGNLTAKARSHQRGLASWPW